MNIQITGRNFELTPKIEEYAKEKAEKLEKFDRNIIFINIILTSNYGHHRTGDIFDAEFVIDRGGKNLVIKETSSDMHAAIDLVSDKAKIILDKETKKNLRKNRIKSALKNIVNR
jgi:ribosomal subunit interface protein